MSHLIDLSRSNNTFSFDDFIIGRKIKFDKDNSKYYVYYQPTTDDAPKEIYLKLPKLRLIYGMGNNKYSQTKLPIYPNWDKTESMIKFIKKLESNILKCFTESYPNIEINSLISKKNMLNFIRVNLPEKYKITSDIGQNVKLTDFKITGEIEMVIKISYIWNRENKIGLSSELYQIKYYAPAEQLGIDFIDFIDEKTKSIEVIKPIIPMGMFKINPMDLINKSLLLNKVSENKIEIPQQIKIGMPNKDDLLKAIRGLKPTNNNE